MTLTEPLIAKLKRIGFIFVILTLVWSCKNSAKPTQETTSPKTSILETAYQPPQKFPLHDTVVGSFTLKLRRINYLTYDSLKSIALVTKMGNGNADDLVRLKDSCVYVTMANHKTDTFLTNRSGGENYAKFELLQFWKSAHLLKMNYKGYEDDDDFLIDVRNGKRWWLSRHYELSPDSTLLSDWQTTPESTVSGEPVFSLIHIGRDSLYYMLKVTTEPGDVCEFHWIADQSAILMETDFDSNFKKINPVYWSLEIETAQKVADRTKVK